MLSVLTFLKVNVINLHNQITVVYIEKLCNLSKSKNKQMFWSVIIFITQEINKFQVNFIFLD